LPCPLLFRFLGHPPGAVGRCDAAGGCLRKLEG